MSVGYWMFLFLERQKVEKDRSFCVGALVVDDHLNLSNKKHSKISSPTSRRSYQPGLFWIELESVVEGSMFLLTF